MSSFLMAFKVGGQATFSNIFWQFIQHLQAYVVLLGYYSRTAAERFGSEAYLVLAMLSLGIFVRKINNILWSVARPPHSVEPGKKDDICFFFFILIYSLTSCEIAYLLNSFSVCDSLHYDMCIFDIKLCSQVISLLYPIVLILIFNNTVCVQHSLCYFTLSYVSLFCSAC